MSLLVQIFDIVTEVLTVFFLLRLALDSRDFYFNPVLQPVLKVTSKPLNRMEDILPKRFQGLAPVICIVLLLAFKSLALTILTASPAGAQIARDAFHLFKFLLQAYLVLFLVTLALPAHSGNIFARIAQGLTDPLVSWSKRFIPGKGGRAALGMVLVLGLHFVVMTGIRIGLEVLQGGGVLAPASFASHLVGQAQYTLLAGNDVIYFVSLALFVRVLLSWFSPDPRNPLVLALYLCTDPVLKPFQAVLPPLGGLDLSPIIAFFALGLVSRLLQQYILQLSMFLN